MIFPMPIYSQKASWSIRDFGSFIKLPLTRYCWWIADAEYETREAEECPAEKEGSEERKWTFLQQVSDGIWHARRRVQALWDQSEIEPPVSNKRSHADISDAPEDLAASAGTLKLSGLQPNSPETL